MIFPRIMTTDKDYSNEEANYNYYTVAGSYDGENPKRMSPSSWDDSEEEHEQTDTNSTLDSSDLKQTRFYDASVTNEALEEEEDRRQSSARVRRRKKDSTKSSIVLPETDVCSPTDNSFIAWDDQDSDGVTFDIEIYLNQPDFSQTVPKESVFLFNESGTLNTRNRHELTKISEDNDNFRNLKAKLSKIVEVDESKSNLSLESTDKSQFVTPTANSSAGSKSSTSVRRAEVGTAEEKITPLGEEKDEAQLSRGAEIFAQERNRARNRIRPTMMENVDDMDCKDIEYFDNTVIYFFDADDSIEVQGTRSFNYEEDGLYFGKQIPRDYLESTEKIEENELFQSFREVNSAGGRNDAEDKISIDKVEDVSNCTDTTHESGTPKRHGNLTGREKDHALSKESLELGLENLFSLTRETSSAPSTSKSNRDLPQSTIFDLFQMNECFSRDVSPSRMYEDRFLTRLTQSDDSCPNSPLDSRIINPEDTAVSPEIPSDRCIENEDSKGEVLFKLLRKYPSVSKSQFGNELKVDDVDEGSIRTYNKSKSSFKSNISLESYVSDKSSTTEMKIYGESFSEMESSVNSENVMNNGKSPSSINHKLSKTGKLSTTRSDALLSNEKQISLSKQDKFGFGDFDTKERETVRNADYPRDRGDMSFESYSVKSDWGRLIVQLDERCRINRPAKSIFRIDVQENLRSNRAEDHRDEYTKPVKSFERFSKRCTRGRGGTWKITKAKKTKRETAFADDSYDTDIIQTISNNPNRIIKKNWLVNKFNTKRTVLRRGTGSLKTFLIMRSRGRDRKKRSYRHPDQPSHFMDNSTSGVDCFRTLFRQLVDFFTVFCHKNKN